MRLLVATLSLLILLAPPALALTDEGEENRRSAAAAGDPRDATQPTERAEPLVIGFEMDTTVSLALIDVEVRDREGNPTPGLSKKDFWVRLGRHRIPLYSVDDLCPCSTDDTPQNRAVSRSDESRKVILYFDFTHLQPDGRQLALESAEAWIRSDKLAEDVVTVVAFSEAAGLVEVAPYTSDRGELQNALEALKQERNPISSTQAWRGDQDAWRRHGNAKRSLRALLFFLQGLESLRGPKDVFFFHQAIVPEVAEAPTVQAATVRSITETPSQYAARRIGKPPTLGQKKYSVLPLMEEVGGVAMAVRARVFPMFCGDVLGGSRRLVRQALNFGANLADFTGGRHNRGPFDLGPVLTATGTDCRCTYRLGLAPLDSQYKSGVYRLKVGVNDGVLPYSYRLRLMSEYDRWLARKRSALLNPGMAREIPVGVALVPEVIGAKSRVRIQVAVNLAGIAMVPGSTLPIGNWIVGATLRRTGTSWSRSMLGTGQLWATAPEDLPEWILHERVLDSLRPGTYEVRTFIQDRWASTLGGAQGSLYIPRPSASGVTGPVMLRHARDLLSMDLPIQKKKRKKSTPVDNTDLAVVSSGSEGVVPQGPEPVHRGETLEFRTWICQPKHVRTPRRYARFVTLGDAGLFRYPDDQPASDPPCAKFVDILNTADLAPGEYRYHVQSLDPGTAGDLLHGEVDFWVTGESETTSEPTFTEGSDNPFRSESEERE